MLPGYKISNATRLQAIWFAALDEFRNGCGWACRPANANENLGIGQDVGAGSGEIEISRGYRPKENRADRSALFPEELELPVTGYCVRRLTYPRPIRPRPSRPSVAPPSGTSVMSRVPLNGVK